MELVLMIVCLLLGTAIGIGSTLLWQSLHDGAWIEEGDDAAWWELTFVQSAEVEEDDDDIPSGA